MKDKLVVNGRGNVGIQISKLDLLRQMSSDPTLLVQAKGFFTNVALRPYTRRWKSWLVCWAKEETLAKDFGCCRKTVSDWKKGLEPEWATVINLGPGRSQVIALHIEKGKAPNRQERELILLLARAEKMKHHREMAAGKK